MQSLTFIILIVSAKVTTLKFLSHSDTWQASLLAGWPYADHYTDLHISDESWDKKAACSQHKILCPSNEQSLFTTWTKPFNGYDTQEQ